MANLEPSHLNSSLFGANDGPDGGFVNESVEEYLLRMLGPKHLPLAVVVPITLIYVTIFVSGVVGNVAVCVVIARNKSMRTATNYYLFSLAVSDLMLLLLGECTERLNASTTDISNGTKGMSQSIADSDRYSLVPACFRCSRTGENLRLMFRGCLAVRMVPQRMVHSRSQSGWSSV
jgi:hypothetical protein